MKNENAKGFRARSREDWFPGEAPKGTEPISVEKIKLGAILRIADAVETMAERYQILIEERDQYARVWKEEQERRRHSERRIASLHGFITRMRRAAKEQKL